MSHPFAYARASTVDDAIGALDADCRPLAGGTDLLRLIEVGLAKPQCLVSLRELHDLAKIEQRGEGWNLGALTTLARLAQDGSVGQHLPVLQQATLASASPQLRQMATLGGNLLQRPRCWYYRDARSHCWLKGGARCFAADGRNERHALFGGGPCYIVHPSDPATALLALDAQVVVAGPWGSRRVPLERFFRLPRQEVWSETALQLNELIAGVLVPAPPAGARGAYVKVAGRAAWDFALASAAVQLAFDGDVVIRARIVLGGVAPVPWRVEHAESDLVGRPLSDGAIRDAARAASEYAEPLSHNAYKVDLIRGVVTEAVRRLRK
jgi:xanthine dehydrogenase YagS FAD-binding subunit